MNLDNYIEGDFDPNNPANWDETIDAFESDNISECYDYAYEFSDYEPLQNAIDNQVYVIESVLSELQLCIDSLAKNVFTKNKLIAIKRKLELTQIKKY